jgi:ceramide glucosyltransferase
MSNNRLINLFAAGLCSIQALKLGLIARFFHKAAQPSEQDRAELPLVSILQPILSGDDQLASCLEHNLQIKSRYPLEFIWLIDDNDPQAHTICRELIARNPHACVRVISLPNPPEDQSPKMVKLVAGAAHAHGEIICVLDDDTMLPDHGLESCLPALDREGIGLAFGLPYYTSFSNSWSSLVAGFVNSNSLLTYVPYTFFNPPFSINGMFFALKRTTLEQIGGFAGLEHILADDFAIAQRVRSHGLQLAQTPLLHAIHTTIPNGRSYLNLIQRWFIFPRESLLRHLSWREQGLLYLLVVLPTLGPLLLALAAPWSRAARNWLALFLLGDLSAFLVYNRRLLKSATAWRFVWMIPLLKLLLPIQLLVALCSPQRIRWRGHLIEVEKGGGFRIIERRKN